MKKSEITAIAEALAGGLKVQIEKGVRQSAEPTVAAEPNGTTKEHVSIVKYLRGQLRGNWDNAPDEERISKALNTTHGTAGGFLIPPQVSTDLIERLKEEAVIRSMVTRPILNMDENGKTTFNAITASVSITWGSETAEMVEDETMTFGQDTLVGKKAKGMYKLSNELLNSNSAGAEGIVRQDLVESLALAEDKCVLEGTGGEQPLGIYYHPGVLSTDLSGAISFDDLKDAIYRIRAENGKLTGWVINPRTLNALEQLKDSNGRYLITQYGDPSTGVTRLIGYPFRDTTQISTTNRPGSDETYMVGGNWGDIILGESPVRIEAFEQTYAQEDVTLIRLVKYFGYMLRHPQQFVVIKGITE